ncbi:MAG: exodeoxyribonuclease VII small subunit [Burkholderiales bacterium]|nr:exodeoxyribonuclease VII small subunit [Burkholderiales bacterium]
MAKTPSPTAAGAAAPADALKDDLRFEDALEELERLVEQMEAGQLPLDQLLQRYQRGTELLALCRQRLEAVEAQVKVLEDGQLKPWAGA